MAKCTASVSDNSCGRRTPGLALPRHFSWPRPPHRSNLSHRRPVFSGTLGGTATTIPSVGTSGATGSVLLGLVGQNASITTGPGNCSFFDGTSMATPHVSGVAALVWSHNTSWTNQQVRDALAATAEDLGSGGRDNTYGWGLVRALAAPARPRW
ncbi:MAG: S8 family serine peptidase [Acidobacteria bacterium]|nr:S8 family serine peptidase [Acidobacteriota bacterium]